MSDELEAFPSPSVRDAARTGVRAALAALPLGGTVMELFDAVMAPALERRQRAWFERLAEVMEEIKFKVDGFDPDRLAENDCFVTGVIEATRIALSTHRQEKLGYLRNVLIRLAIDTDDNEFFAMRMLRFVDTLTPEHFVVLKCWSDPTGWYEAKGIQRPNISQGATGSIMEKAHLPLDGTNLEIVNRDLDDHGLAQVDPQSLNIMVSAHGMWSPQSTDLGNSLLEFVSDSA